MSSGTMWRAARSSIRKCRKLSSQCWKQSLERLDNRPWVCFRFFLKLAGKRPPPALPMWDKLVSSLVRYKEPLDATNFFKSKLNSVSVNEEDCGISTIWLKTWSCQRSPAQQKNWTDTVAAGDDWPSFWAVRYTSRNLLNFRAKHFWGAL